MAVSALPFNHFLGERKGSNKTTGISALEKMPPDYACYPKFTYMSKQLATHVSTPHSERVQTVNILCDHCYYVAHPYPCWAENSPELHKLSLRSSSISSWWVSELLDVLLLLYLKMYQRLSWVWSHTGTIHHLQSLWSILRTFQVEPVLENLCVALARFQGVSDFSDSWVV